LPIAGQDLIEFHVLLPRQHQAMFSSKSRRITVSDLFDSSSEDDHVSSDESIGAKRPRQEATQTGQEATKTGQEATKRPRQEATETGLTARSRRDPIMMYPSLLSRDSRLVYITRLLQDREASFKMLQETLRETDGTDEEKKARALCIKRVQRDAVEQTIHFKVFSSGSINECADIAL
jgi:hypothetical protein